MLSILGKIFSGRHFETFFLFFPENRIFCEKQENIFTLSSAEIAQRVANVKSQNSYDSAHLRIH